MAITCMPRASALDCHYKFNVSLSGTSGPACYLGGRRSGESMSQSAVVKSRKGSDFPDAENLALRRARKELIALQQELTALHFKIASRIDALKAAVGAEKLPGALVAECRVSPELVATYIGMYEHLQEHRETLVEKCASISVMGDLVAADEATRLATLHRLASGSLVTSGDTAAMAREARKAAVPTEEREARARRRYLSGIVSRKTVRPAIESFESTVRKLAGKLNEFHTGNPQIRRAAFAGYNRIDSSAPAYREGHQSIRESAAPVLIEFERIYGVEHIAQADWSALAARRPQAVRLAMAHNALSRLASGRFGHDGGFTFDCENRSVGRRDMLHALQYLSATKLPLPTAMLPVSFNSSRPRVIELCAGVGGQALGLQAAGLEIVAAFEKWKPASKALKANRPSMHVVGTDIAKDPERLFAPFANRIDIVSGGLPCQPYSGRGNGEGQFDQRDLFPTAVRIVRTVQPKAFFFENVEGFGFHRHRSHRAGILSDLAAEGYKVWMPTLNSRHFGVPQDRKRVLVIGMRPDIARRFKMPSPRDHVAVPLGEALKELLFPHRSRGIPEGPSPSPKQARYDEWFNWWMEKFGGCFAPTVTRFGQSAQFTSSWRKNGFDGSGVADRPPSLEDVHVGYLPKPTIAMLKRIQGLPDQWMLGSSEDAKLQQIANAFPPQVARAIGLALRQAMTGECLDMDRLTAKPITGRGPKLNRSDGIEVPDPLDLDD